VDKKKVLVVDDVALNLTTMKTLLSAQYDVRIAKSGSLALFILGSVKVDLILLDIEMPGMSGFEFLETIREIPDVADTPVIFVTTHATADIVDRARKAGAAGYIVKPINSKALFNKMSEVFENRDLEKILTEYEKRDEDNA
jgi:CheY-like chemotaxis protein